jgi:glutamate/tyrosine decarboxylase-like PLP-dependent enzyme
MPADANSFFDQSIDEMDEVWSGVGQIAKRYRQDLPGLRVSPPLDPEQLRNSIQAFKLDDSRGWREVLSWIDDHMRNHQLHAGHPQYFGLFNPAPLPLGIAADALTAAYNPQLAAWSHSPFAVELERALIHEFGIQFGFPKDSIDGTFCTGGAEANHTALLCALTTRFSNFAREGLRALPGQPTLYISESAHHSWTKAARACGLGTTAVRTIPCEASHQLNTEILRQRLFEDRRAGYAPVLICGTAGTTSAGVIDPLRKLAELAKEAGVWYHVDAAWGGAVRFVPEYQNWLAGIEEADSVTFDAHKFLSIPMGAGVFLTRNTGALAETFRISTDYMPRDASLLAVTEPHAHSLQWSRRFIGLKVFLPIAAMGWSGVAELIRRQCRLGSGLRQMLIRDGWLCLNETPLPVVCFTAEEDIDGGMADLIVKRVVESGSAWISNVNLHQPAIRACVTNFRTTENDLEALLSALNQARAALR